jgi:transposase-like protein
MQNEPRYYCRDCYAHYTVTVQTLFHKTHTDLRKWYLLIALVMDSRKLPSVEALAQAVQVNKNTISRMVRQVRQAIQTEFNLLVRITDEVTKDD